MRVNLGKDSYDIIIEQGALDKASEYVQSVYQGNKIVIISDDNVYPIYGHKIEGKLSQEFIVHDIVLPHGEKTKNFDILPEIYSQLLSFHLTRTDLIIALGGGVIGDLAGFVASTILRGVKLIQIPTSLLAQVDSSVGGKVAVDLKEGKNLVGAFKHPSLVIIDPLTLKTLDQRYINDGMGEVIKYGCIRSASLFDKLANYKDFDDLYKDIDEIIGQCVDIKRDVVEKDLYDFGDRLILNFGHTLAHAVEQYYHYEKYSHGEAVAIGMVQLTRIAEKKGMCQNGLSQKIKEVCIKYNLPSIAHLSSQDLSQAISLDKKNINKKLSYVLLKDIGETYIYPSDLTFIEGEEI